MKLYDATYRRDTRRPRGTPTSMPPVADFFAHCVYVMMFCDNPVSKFVCSNGAVSYVAQPPAATVRWVRLLSLFLRGARIEVPYRANASSPIKHMGRVGGGNRTNVSRAPPAAMISVGIGWLYML